VKLEASIIEWRDEHDAQLAVSAGDDLALLKQQAKRGQATLWQCSKDGESEALVLTRLDGQDNPEFVIVLGEGRGFFDYMPLFVHYAKKNNWPIRTHVKRKGLLRMWSRLGLELDEYVLRGKP
jgi:hypothetical protein